MSQIEKFERKGDLVDLIYSDGEIVVVKYEDFNRAFGAILGASKEDVKRDFEIKQKGGCL